MYFGIAQSKNWKAIMPISKGWSSDKKYLITTENSVPYCIGQIDASFNDDIPTQFWITLAVYVAQASLFSIKWAEKFGQKDINGMVKRCRHLRIMMILSR